MLCKTRFRSDFLFLKCLFYGFKFFGIASMSIDTNSSAVKINNVPKEVHFEFSKVGRFYNVILVLLSIIPSYITMKQAYQIEYANRLQLERVIDVVHVIGTIVTYFILVSVCINQKKAVAIANQLSSIYSQSASLSTKSNIRSDQVLRSAKKIVFTHVVLAILSCGFALTFINYDLIYHLFIDFTNVTIYAMALQYSLVLKLLHHIYRSLNADLRSLLITRVSSGILVPSDGFQSSLKQLYEIHVSLSCVSKDVSDLYSLPMFFIFVIAFFTLILFIYYCMVVFLLMPVELNFDFVLPFYLTLLALVIFAMWTLARTAGVVVKESKVAREIVSESIVNQGNQPISRQLRDFSHYLQQKDVSFNVFDLFSINESLLMSFASSICTYLVILLQFKESNSMQ